MVRNKPKQIKHNDSRWALFFCCSRYFTANSMLGKKSHVKDTPRKACWQRYICVPFTWLRYLNVTFLWKSMKIETRISIYPLLLRRCSKPFIEDFRACSQDNVVAIHLIFLFRRKLVLRSVNSLLNDLITVLESVDFNGKVKRFKSSVSDKIRTKTGFSRLYIGSKINRVMNVKYKNTTKTLRHTGRQTDK